MSMLDTILGAFAPGGNQGVQERKLQMASQKQDMEERKMAALQNQQKSDIDIHQAMLQQGYKPSVNGMVQEDFSDLPGFAGTAPAGSAIPQAGQVPSSVAPVPAQTLLRPIDKSRAVTFNDHTGAPVTYERPGSLLDQMRAIAQANAPARQAAAQQAGDVAQSTEAGRQAGLNTARQQYGVTMPEGSGLASGQKLLPEEVGPVGGGLSQASQIPAQLEQAQLARASQSLGSVTTPGAYKVLYDRLPEGIKDRFDTPDQFDPLKTPMRARMATMSPADQQKTSLLMNTPPEEWSAKVDSAYPPTGPTAAQNKAAHILVDGYIRRGEFDKADAIVKDGLDQQGKTNTAVASAKATAPIKIDVAAASAGARADAAGLSADDYARAGQEYGMTGIMPPMGRDSVTRGRIMKASNDWARDNGFSPRDVVQMQAAFKGDANSLKEFQAKADQISAFEKTASKNLDLFLGAASKIPDTGSPWMNQPLRSLDAKAVGSENMAAVNAARQVANNEIAKVTSGGGLSGVLSDSARHEVEAYNPSDATFKQTVAVANILKQDMANRTGGMQAVLGEIKGRMGQKPGSATQFKPGDMVMYNGAPHKVQSVKPDGKLVLEN